MQELLQKIAKATSPESIREDLENGIRSLGFDRFTAVDAGDYMDDNSIVHFGNNPTAWNQHYHANNYRMADPIVARARRSLMPFSWAQLQAEDNLTRLQRRMFEESRTFGNRSGGTFPVHGPNGSFSFLSVISGLEPETFENLWQHQLYNIGALAFVIHETGRRWTVDKRPTLPNAPADLTDTRLTAREAECLIWSARGKTAADIAAILDIAENTVREHFKRAQRKLGSSSLVQTVARAIINGIITP